MEALNCPSCGSSDLSKISNAEYKCQNCQTNSRLSENKSYLVILKPNTCPKCGEINENNAKFCNSCGSSLTKLCWNCKTSVPIAAYFCNNCGKGLVKQCWNCKTYTPIGRNTCTNCGADLKVQKIEGNSYKVYLCQVEETYKNAVIRLVMSEFNLSQKEAREILNETTRIASDVSYEEATRLKNIFEECGANIEIF